MWKTRASGRAGCAAGSRGCRCRAPRPRRLRPGAGCWNGMVPVHADEHRVVGGKFIAEVDRSPARQCPAGRPGGPARRPPRACGRGMRSPPAALGRQRLRRSVSARAGGQGGRLIGRQWLRLISTRGPPPPSARARPSDRPGPWGRNGRTAARPVDQLLDVAAGADLVVVAHSADDAALVEHVLGPLDELVAAAQHLALLGVGRGASAKIRTGARPLAALWTPPPRFWVPHSDVHDDGLGLAGDQRVAVGRRRGHELRAGW